MSLQAITLDLTKVPHQSTPVPPFSSHLTPITHKGGDREALGLLMGTQVFRSDIGGANQNH